jgi:hypothetical protein
MKKDKPDYSSISEDPKKPYLKNQNYAILQIREILFPNMNTIGPF